MKIKKILIENFKGIKSLEADFDDAVCISGRNGSGKSSVMDAYFWCLFNKNGQGSQFVAYPLDKNNEPIHKVQTSVELILDNNGVEVSVRRTQSEDWSKPTGTTVEQLKGYKQERFIDGVPLGVQEFGNRLNEMLNTDDWFMLSSISAFMSMKMEDRRRRLMKLVLAVSDEDLAEDFPILLAELRKGKTIEDIAVTAKMSKKKADNDLQLMPARMDQNEKLKVNYDFNALEAEANTIDTEISALRHDIESSSVDRDLEKSEELRKKLSAVAKEMCNLEDKVRSEVSRAISEINTKKSDAEIRYKTSQGKITSLENLEKQYYSEIHGDGGFECKLNSLRTKWKECNSRDTESEVTRWAEEHADDVATVCPTCGQALPVEMVENSRNIAVEGYRNKINGDKVSELRSIESEAKSVKAKIEERERMLESNAELIKQEREKLESYSTTIKECDEKLSKCETYESAISKNEEYKSLTAKHEELKQQVSSIGQDDGRKNENESRKARVKELEGKLKEVREKLAQKQANERCDKQRLELEKENKDLLQAVADCEKMLNDIMLFKKAKMTMVENRVNSLFKIVRFKMYEPNLTNDGEKEICKPIVDGVPYELLNTASRVNAGVDIINGISEALGVQVPIFVDNKESVSVLIGTRQQTITLEVDKNSDLRIM